MTIQEAQAKVKALSEEQDKIFTALRKELNLAKYDDLSDWLFDTLYNDGDVAKFEEKYKDR
jgi:hypothetical protein